MPGRVFITGGSGFVGSAVIDELVGRGYEIAALSHRRRMHPTADRVRTIHGDVSDARALDEGMRGCDAVIHLVGIIMEKRSKGVTFRRMHVEGTMSVVDAVKRNAVRRYLHMSALGTRPNAVSEYHRTKHEAEEYVRASGLEWTIFRPSLIHGPGGEFMTMEAAWARKKAPPPVFFMPFMPYFGGRNAGRTQPVYVKDVARAFADALEKPQTIGQTYAIGGPEQFTWPQMHRLVSEVVVGHARMTAAMPVPVAKALAAVGVAPLLGFNRDQVIMSQEDNTCDLTPFTATFGWQPRPFRQTLEGYAKEL